MKIVHLCLCGVFGENYAYQDNLITKYHKRMGHDVTIIAPQMAKFTANGDIVYEPVGVKSLNNGCKLIRVRTKYKSQKLNSRLHLFEDITAIIIGERPNLIFVHNLSTFNNLCLLRVKKLLPNVKIVFDNHMDEYNSNKNILSKFLNGFIFRHFVVRRILHLSNKFYGVTPSRCTFLKDIFGVPEEKIDYLPMGADDEKMDLDRKFILRERVRGEYGISDDDFLIVTGGKIDKLKHIDILAKAVNEMHNPKVKILLFGSITDELKPIINSLLSERIIYIGWIASETVYKYFYAADLVMFPGLHSAMWEQAAASRVPMAVSELRGFDHVNFNNNCLFLNGCGIDYYKNFIENIVFNKSVYTKLRQNAESNGAQKFLYSNIALKVINDIK